MNYILRAGDIGSSLETERSNSLTENCYKKLGQPSESLLDPDFYEWTTFGRSANEKPP